MLYVKNLFLSYGNHLSIIAFIKFWSCYLVIGEIYPREKGVYNIGFIISVGVYLILVKQDVLAN